MINEKMSSTKAAITTVWPPSVCKCFASVRSFKAIPTDVGAKMNNFNNYLDNLIL